MNSTQLPIVSTQGSPDGLVSPMDPMYRRVQYLTLVTISVSVFGLGANVINLIVFVRLGFKEIVNISLFCLAVSDFFTLILLVFNSVCLIPWNEDIDWPFQPADFQSFAAWLVAVLTIHSNLLAAFITTERSICVILPLKVKLIMTPKVAIIFATVSFFVVMLVFLPWYIRLSFSWIVDSVTGKSILTIVINDRGSLYHIVYTLMLLLLLASNVSLLVATVVLVVSLKRKSKWRKQTVTSPSDKQQSLSTRDAKISNMIIAISSIVLICHSLDVVLILGSIIDTEFEYHDIVTGCWIIAKFLYSINCSFNIFFYYKMSTNFREMFRSMILKTK